MLFTSPAFLFLFLPLVLAVYYAAPARWRNALLLLASLVFYGWWRLDFVLLLLASTSLDYLCAGRIARLDRAAQPRGRRAWLTLSIGANLGVLAYFKYWRFGVDTLHQVLVVAGEPGVSGTWAEVLIPVGISFYTFQTMSYTIDVYRGDVEPARSWVDFACYVTLFPQLIAGPIVRFREIAAQLRQRHPDLATFSRGALLFQIGFAKKVLLADSLSGFVGRVYASPEVTWSEAWCANLACAFQVYFDFSGYSDMAIGLGLMLGFMLPRNFEAPFQAASMTEFWRRWHITLSTWIRDYLFLPLGGSRGGTLATCRTILITMALAGLWHGANWTFVAWGVYHGVVLCLERISPRRSLLPWAPHPVRVLVTFAVLVMSLAFFRGESLPQAWHVLLAMWRFDGAGFVHAIPDRAEVLAAAVGAVLVFAGRPARWWVERRGPWFEAGIAVVFLLALAELFFRAFQPFVYFRF